MNIQDTSPNQFYRLVDIQQSVTSEYVTGIQAFLSAVDKNYQIVNEQTRILSKANADLHQENRNSMMHRNTFESLEKQQDDFLNFIQKVSDKNFISVSYGVMVQLQRCYEAVVSIAKDLRPRPLVLREKRFSGHVQDFSEFQHMKAEFEFNSPALQVFFRALDDLRQLESKMSAATMDILHTLENYYQKLVHRHTIENVKIHRDPVVTDIAMLVFQNIDKHGEIAAGTKADEVSAYTLRKAEILTQALREPTVHKFIQNPSTLTEYLVANLRALSNTTKSLNELFEKQLNEYQLIVDERSAWGKSSWSPHINSIEGILTLIGDIDPKNVAYKESNKILSSEERFNQKFREETLDKLTELLSSNDLKAEEIVKYVLTRKAELKKFFQEENSFYVCKIGSGNPFLGVSPGALEVIPGEKPNSNLDNILGSGFQEVKEFIKSIKDSAKWHNLFLASSPSKSTDKSNVLLVGPMGSGKTEVFRAVASDSDSISISVQGSDFNTCWKGEMEKNPKRMFQEGVRLQKESGRHVHFLIDEIDSVLNDDKEFGTSNLTLEFQILMDGVVRYPNLSVWGATNSPQRIPMPMIRRFNFISIVGELDKSDRHKLLKHYVANYLPHDMFSDEPWDLAADKLRGATGDIIRKIADHIWRTKMSWFVNNKPKEAEEMLRFLEGDSGQFNLAKFSDEERKTFQNRLSNHFKVTAEDLHRSVDQHLTNIAIQSEIQTAIRVYNESRAFIEAINNGKV